MTDESHADDGVLHELWREIDPTRVAVVMGILHRLVIHRGDFDDDDRADAAALADDVEWPLGHLPIVREAMAS